MLVELFLLSLDKYESDIMHSCGDGRPLHPWFCLSFIVLRLVNHELVVGREWRNSFIMLIRAFAKLCKLEHKNANQF